MKPVTLMGMHPEHLRLMQDGVAYRIMTNQITMKDGVELMEFMAPSENNPYVFIRLDCGCESVMFLAETEEKYHPKKEDFCSHVSK